jgi:hypothetical protein
VLTSILNPDPHGSALICLDLDKLLDPDQDTGAVLLTNHEQVVLLLSSSFMF